MEREQTNRIALSGAHFFANDIRLTHFGAMHVKSAIGTDMNYTCIDIGRFCEVLCSSVVMG